MISRQLRSHYTLSKTLQPRKKAENGLVNPLPANSAFSEAALVIQVHRELTVLKREKWPKVSTPKRSEA